MGGRGRALNEYQTYGRTQTVTAYRKGSIPIASPTTSHLRRPSSTTAPATKSTLTRSSGSGFEGQPRPLPIPRRNVSWTIQFCAPYEASVDQTEGRCAARGREPSNHQLRPPRSPKARKPSRIPFYTASSLVESRNQSLAGWRVESGAMIPARRWSGPGPARRLPVPHRLSSAGRPAELWR